MKGFKTNRPKKLDLVLCTPATQGKARSLADLANEYQIVLTDEDRDVLGDLPKLYEAPVGAVHCAVEAKACMTEHMKARPRLYDELNSSQQTIHGATDVAIAVGFVMVNVATTYVSPGRMGTPSVHRQPDVTARVIEKLKELPRRTSTGEEGFDALAIAVVDCRNDGTTRVRLVDEPPAPSPGDIFHYDLMIHRLAHLYASRFPLI